MGEIDQHDDGSDRDDRGQQMRIFSGPLSMFGAKVEIAAREKGIVDLSETADKETMV
jgi:hypothetical protein